MTRSDSYAPPGLREANARVRDAGTHGWRHGLHSVAPPGLREWRTSMARCASLPLLPRRGRVALEDFVDRGGEGAHHAGGHLGVLDRAVDVDLEQFLARAPQQVVEERDLQPPGIVGEEVEADLLGPEVEV